MSNIEQNLQKILSTRFGKDVRQAIHDGIHDCYEDGKTGAVDLVAREQIANLVANNNPTDGNSELIDIRVGFDETVYDSAGEAVRGQITEVNERITETIGSIISKIVNSDTSVKIKLLGDSITHGQGGSGFSQDGEEIMTVTDWGENPTYTFRINTKGICWANMLKQYFKEKFNCTVINYGCAGIDSNILINNINTLISKDDDIIICMIGTNDRNHGNLITFENNLRNIVKYCLDEDKKVILMSSIPASASNEENKTVHMEDIDNVIMKVSYENHMEYISVYKLFTEYCKYKNVNINTLLSDGLHPNDNGYLIMFYLICSALGIAINENLEGITGINKTDKKIIGAISGIGTKSTLDADIIELKNADSSVIYNLTVTAKTPEQNGTPTPDNMIPLSITSDPVSLFISGKNLISSYAFSFSNGTYLISDSSYNEKGTIPVIGKKGYCMSIDSDTESNDGAIYMFDDRGLKIGTEYFVRRNAKKICHFITPQNCATISFYVKISDGENSENCNPVLTYGYKFVEVKEKGNMQNIIIAGSGNFSGAPSVQDYAEIKDGAIFLHKRVHYQKVPVDLVTKSSYSNRFIISGSKLDYLPLLEETDSDNILSNAFLGKIPATANDNGVTIASNNNITFGYDSTKSVEEFKEFFTQNPLYILYPMKEEIVSVVPLNELPYLNYGYNLIFSKPKNGLKITYKIAENDGSDLDNYKKGVNCTIAKTSELDDLKNKIIESHELGINEVSLLLSNAFQSNTSSVLDDIDKNVISVLSGLLEFCAQIGMGVNIRCTCYSKTTAGGENIQPTDLEAWFDNWEKRIEMFMDIAYPYGVRVVSISNELKYLNSLPEAKPYWYKIINDLKIKYKDLKVAINHNIYDKTINVLELFDVIGFNCYPCLTRKGLNESFKNLSSSLHSDIYTDDNIGYILNLAEKYPDKEIWISEIGTQSDEKGLFQTWQNTYAPAEYNEEVQKIYYELIMQNIFKIKGTSGMFLWSINDGRGGNNGFSFLGKSAESIVAKYWNGGVKL